MEKENNNFNKQTMYISNFGLYFYFVNNVHQYEN